MLTITDLFKHDENTTNETTNKLTDQLHN